MPYNFLKAQVAPEPIDASNPASGINNIQMQGGIDIAGAEAPAAPASSSNGVSASDAKRILNQVASAGMKANEYKGLVEDLYNRMTNENIQEKVGKLLQALEKNNDQSTQTTDPQTGLKDPTASQLALQIVKEITQMEKEQKNQESKNTVAINSFNLKTAAGKKKKKKDSRGNPFKVLMGKVGKLLDHGISKKDIVRFIMKEGNWNEETVEKAVNLVKDYNKKKHNSGEKTKEEEPDDKKEAQAKSSDKESKKDAKKDGDPCWENYEMVGMKDKDGKSVPNCVPKGKESKTITSNQQFNLKKFAQTSLELDGLYGIQPEWSKRSTAELITRASWLISLQNYDEKIPQGDGKKASNKKGVTAQLKDIKKALTERGFDGEELFDNLKRGF